MNEFANDQNFAANITEVGMNAVTERINQAAENLNNTSKEKYECKKHLIETAEDMTTKEKLDALDQNYDRHTGEVWNNIMIIGLFGLAVAGLISGSPTIIKNVRRLVA